MRLASVSIPNARFSISVLAVAWHILILIPLSPEEEPAREKEVGQSGMVALMEGRLHQEERANKQIQLELPQWEEGHLPQCNLSSCVPGYATTHGWLT